MAEGFLDQADVFSVPQKVRGEGMPQGVRVYAFIKAGLAGITLHEVAHVTIAHAAAGQGAEQIRAATLAHRAPALEGAQVPV